MTIDCAELLNGCFVCPALPAVASTPQQIIYSPVNGWGGGGNSEAVLDGDLHVVFQVTCLGAVCVGLRSVEDKNYVPVAVDYALLIQFTAGVLTFVVLESGRAQGSPTNCAAGDTWEIRRVNGAVTYLRNNSVVHTSTVSSEAPLLATACLYTSGDAVL